ncbi:unnamed protein product [Hymenolepis diminuta]|uniref:Uncharacterized protein n=1 Tax=Hymenolepis diminuta TaxID=6216 RepID=A0A564YC74_HYMDI|nr:unnamed protein product [Hymenolepis diminuta]
MRKNVAYHFQSAPEEQTAKGPTAFVQIHPPSSLPQLLQSKGEKEEIEGF